MVLRLLSIEKHISYSDVLPRMLITLETPILGRKAA